MNDHESLEAELRRLKPAAPPQDFRARLATLPPPRPATTQEEMRAPQISVADSWRQILRWLVPTTAGVALLIVAATWWLPKSDPEPIGTGVRVAAKPALRPDAVQIDHQLIAAYDAVAELSSGEPVRFRCQEWMDELVLRNSARGVRIEQRTPRFEVVAAKLETY
jgi:hypothetical protein